MATARARRSWRQVSGSNVEPMTHFSRSFGLRSMECPPIGMPATPHRQNVSVACGRAKVSASFEVPSPGSELRRDWPRSQMCWRQRVGVCSLPHRRDASSSATRDAWMSVDMAQLRAIARDSRAKPRGRVRTPIVRVPIVSAAFTNAQIARPAKP